jgi:hypothetical protein
MWTRINKRTVLCTTVSPVVQEVGVVLVCDDDELENKDNDDEYDTTVDAVMVADGGE